MRQSIIGTGTNLSISDFGLGEKNIRITFKHFRTEVDPNNILLE
jgi:hypothetical protein